jgi:hypothetical protein
MVRASAMWKEKGAANESEESAAAASAASVTAANGCVKEEEILAEKHGLVTVYLIISTPLASS